MSYIMLAMVYGLPARFHVGLARRHSGPVRTRRACDPAKAYSFVRDRGRKASARLPSPRPNAPHPGQALGTNPWLAEPGPGDPRAMVRAKASCGLAEWYNCHRLARHQTLVSLTPKQLPPLLRSLSPKRAPRPPKLKHIREARAQRYNADVTKVIHALIAEEVGARI